MIGNAHIDPVWLWRWDEGFQEVKATFRSALDRMNEISRISSSPPARRPSTNGSSRATRHVRRDPAARRRRPLADRRRLVDRAGLQYPERRVVRPPGSLRAALFPEPLRRTAKVGFNVDSFGHSAMLPQILKKSGLSAYVFMRPSPHEKGLPAQPVLVGIG